MTRPPIPPALAAVGHPWHLTDPDRRREEIKQLRPDPEQRTAALDALDHCLAFLIDEDSRRDEPEVSLPEDFYDSWILYYQSFTRRMPTLGDVSLQTVGTWMAEELDPAAFGMQWTAPPPDYVEAVTRFWVSGAVKELTRHLTRWLQTGVKQTDAAEDKDRMLAALQAAIPRLGWYQAVVMLGTVGNLAGTAAIEYFTRIENDPDLPERTRQEAKGLREARERRLSWETS